MTENSYSLELWVDSEPVSDDDREEVVMELAREVGIKDHVRIGGRTRYLSEDPLMWISLGTLIITSLDATLRLLEYLENEEDKKLGDSNTPDGRPVHIENIEGDVIVNNGGTVLGKLSAGTVFSADGDEFHEIMEAHYGEEEWEQRQEKELDEILERHGYERK